MCTVLAGRDQDEISSYFSSHGTRKTNYFQNQSALDEWLLQLKSSFNSSETSQDSRLIKIVQKMCQQDPDMRLEAQDIVRRIFEFDSAPPYHGICCSKERWIKGSYGTPRAPSLAEPYESDDEKTMIADDEIVPEPEQFKYLSYPEHYQPPTVEEAEITLRAICNVSPYEAQHLLENVTQALGEADMEDVPSAELETSSKKHSRQGYQVQSRSTPRQSQTSDPTSQETRPLTMEDGPKTLDEHLGDSARSKSRGKDAKDPVKYHPLPMPVPINTHENRKAPHYELPKLNAEALPCPWPNCKPPKGLAVMLFDGIESLRGHLRDMHFVHEYAWTRLFDDRLDRLSQSRSLSPRRGTMILANSESKSSPTPKQERFPGLPEERRPKQRLQSKPPRSPQRKLEYNINAERLEAPSTGHSGSEQAEDFFGIPQATFAPSYLLGKTACLQ